MPITMTAQTPTQPIDRDPAPAPTLVLDGSERRRHPRLGVDRACKLFRPELRRYEPAHTANISAGGCLIEVRSSRPLGPGERVNLGVAWTGQPLVRARQLLEAEVVRVSPGPEGAQVVALRFCGRATALAAA